MKTIRLNTFETNSSSCHCLVICGKNKLKEFRERKVVALSDVRIDSDYDVREITIPDDHFVSIEDAYNKVVEYCEANKDSDKWSVKQIFELENFDFEKFKAIISDEDDDMDSYDMLDTLENAFNVPEVFIHGNYRSPLDAKEITSPKGIEGPISIISTEVEC